MAKVSNYKFQIRGTLVVGGSTVSISNDLETNTEVSFTNEACLLYNDDKTIIERIRGSATGGTLTLSKRGMVNTSETESSGLEKERREGAFGALTTFAPQVVDAIGANTFTAINTFEEAPVLEKGVASVIFANATARNAALGGNGSATKAYTGIQTAGVQQYYNLSTGQWEDVETGTVTPNASTTAAGKVEVATTTEFNAGTDTGDTGALLMGLPSDIKAKNDSQDTATSTNATNIATNTTNIGNNDTDIATNTSAIAEPTTVAGVTGSFANPGSTTVTIDMGGNFKTVEFGLSVSQDYSGNDYHAILIYGKFICGSSGIETNYTSLSKPSGASSNYDLSNGSIVANNMSGVGRSVTAITKTTGSDVLSLTGVYRDGNNLKIDLSATGGGTFSTVPYATTPIIIIN